MNRTLKTHEQAVGVDAVVSTADVTVCYSFDVDCPHCGAELDLCDNDDDNFYSTAIFNNNWGDLEGETAYCPDCEKEFLIGKVEC